VRLVDHHVADDRVAERADGDADERQPHRRRGTVLVGDEVDDHHRAETACERGRRKVRERGRREREEEEHGAERSALDDADDFGCRERVARHALADAAGDGEAGADEERHQDARQLVVADRPYLVDRAVAEQCLDRVRLRHAHRAEPHRRKRDGEAEHAQRAERERRPACVHAGGDAGGCYGSGSHQPASFSRRAR
jgi:hypothetical protein